MARHVVARVDEIAPGTVKRVAVNGRDIGVYNVNGAFFALVDRCPHEGASLCRGRIIGFAASDNPGSYQLLRQGEFIKCPWHGWEFDIRTGKSWCDPTGTFVRQYPVSVEGGGKIVEEQLAVETFPVVVEQDYVVVEA